MAEDEEKKGSEWAGPRLGRKGIKRRKMAKAAKKAARKAKRRKKK